MKSLILHDAGHTQKFYNLYLPTFRQKDAEDDAEIQTAQHSIIYDLCHTPFSSAKGVWLAWLATAEYSGSEVGGS